MDTVIAPSTTLTYPISPDYVKAGHGGTGWTPERAIAEFIANALDEDPNATVTYTNGTLTIEDNGPGIPEEGLLLGYSPKGDAQIGQFGEGSKIGALVLARDETIGAIHIETVGYAFVPTVERRRVLDGVVPRRNTEAPEVLVYAFYPSTRERGTKVTIEVGQKVAKAAMARFRHLSEANYAPPTTAQVILDGKGNVYIGGVYVTTKRAMTASYDLPLAAAKTAQNRDRTVIDTDVLNSLVKGALANTLDPEVHRTFITQALTGKKITESERYFQEVSDPRVRAMFMQIARERFGSRPTYFIPSGQEEAGLDMSDKNGLCVSADGLDSWTMRSLMDLLGVQAARAARERVTHAEKQGTKYVTLTRLPKAQKATLDAAMSAVSAMFGPESMGAVKVYSDTNTYLECADGFYSPNGGSISLRQGILDDAQHTMEVLVHEVGHRMAHRSSGDFTDRSRGFESQLCAMLAHAVTVATSLAAPSGTEVADSTDVATDAQPASAPSAVKVVPPMDSLANVPAERAMLAQVLADRAPAAMDKFDVKRPTAVMAMVGRHTGNWSLLATARPAGWRRKTGSMSPSLIVDFRAHEVIAPAFHLPAYATWLAHMACEAATYGKTQKSKRAGWSAGKVTEAGNACADALDTAGFTEDAALLRGLVVGEGDQGDLARMAVRHIEVMREHVLMA